MRRFLTGCFLIAICTASYAAAPATPPASKPPAAHAPEPKTSEEFTIYTYKEKSGEFTVAVYSLMAAYRPTEPYFPLVVAVGRIDEKHKKGETSAAKKEARASAIIRVTDFAFTDSQGKAYPPATYAQIVSGYKFLMDDKQMLSVEPMNTTGLFPESDPVGAAFYPVEGGVKMECPEFELDTYTNFESSVYFPHPDAGFGGVLTLTLKNEWINPPISVKFKIPELKEKKQKEPKKKG